MDRAQQNKAHGEDVAGDVLELADAARDFITLVDEFRNVELDPERRGPWLAFMVSDEEVFALLRTSLGRIRDAAERVYPPRDGPPPQPG